jgi:hypothetical protein
MQSWSLKKFVELYGLEKAILIWGVSRQAIEKAISKGRSIQIVYIDGKYSVHEKKCLATRSEKDVK